MLLMCQEVFKVPEMILGETAQVVSSPSWGFASIGFH